MSFAKKPASKKIYIGSRGSKLALKQSLLVKNLILTFFPDYQENPNLIEIIPIKTSGDKIRDRSLADIGGKGLFVKEIEQALFDNVIDIAVHSMKDLPAFSLKGLRIAAVTERENPFDAFISEKYNSINDLPDSAVVGTCSARRKALLLRIRPDLKIVDFRGNVESRLKKLADNKVQATILAVAGLKRINKQNYITKIIDDKVMLPAVAQGAIGVQIRHSDKFMAEISAKINHLPSSICVAAERAFLEAINGSCTTPLAAYCYFKEADLLHFRALICSPDGKQIYETERFGKADKAVKIGMDAALETKKNAGHILDLLDSRYEG